MNNRTPNFAFCTVAYGDKYVKFSDTIINQVTSQGYTIYVMTDQPDHYKGMNNVVVMHRVFPYFSYHHKRFVAQECLKTFEGAFFLDADVVLENSPDLSVFESAMPGFHVFANFGNLGQTLLADDISRFPEGVPHARNTKYGKELRDLLDSKGYAYKKLFHGVMDYLEHPLEGRWLIKKGEGKEQKFFEIWDMLADFTEKKDIELGYLNSIGAGEGGSMAVAIHNSGMTLFSVSPYVGFILNHFVSNYVEKMNGTKPWNLPG